MKKILLALCVVIAAVVIMRFSMVKAVMKYDDFVNQALESIGDKNALFEFLMDVYRIDNNTWNNEFMTQVDMPTNLKMVFGAAENLNDKKINDLIKLILKIQTDKHWLHTMKNDPEYASIAGYVKKMLGEENSSLDDFASASYNIAQE